MIRKIFTTLIVISTLSLTACGGGGTAESTPKVPQPPSAPLNITVSASDLSVDESTSTQITLSYANADGDVSLTVDGFVSDFTSEQYTVNVDNVGKTITVVMGDIYVDGNLSFTITGQDNSESDAVNVTLSVVNTSVVATLDKLTVLTTSFNNLSGATEDRNILSRLNDLSVLLGVITESTASARMQSIDSLLDETAYSILSNALEQKDYSALYQTGTDEEVLNEVLTAVEKNLSLYSGQLYSLLIDAQQVLGDNIIATFPENAFYFDVDNNTVSRFWQNPSLGQVVDGSYSFNDEYDYLDAILFPESQLCNQ